jgi:hypothetical protein
VIQCASADQLREAHATRQHGFSGRRAISAVTGGAVTIEVDTMDAYDYGTDTVGVGNCLDSVGQDLELARFRTGPFYRRRPTPRAPAPTP